VSKFVYKYNKSQLPATFNNYFKFITNVHPSNTSPTKTRNFALPKSRSNSGVKMLRYSTIEIWSEIRLEIKNKRCLTRFTAEMQKMCYSGTTAETLLAFLFCWCALTKCTDYYLTLFYYENIFIGYSCFLFYSIWFLFRLLRLSLQL